VGGAGSAAAVGSIGGSSIGTLPSLNRLTLLTPLMT